MSLYVYVAHTGIRLKYLARAPSSLEQIQSWITEKTSIDASNQILLDIRGKGLKAQNWHQETEIYLYDKRILSSNAAASISSLVPRTPIPHTSSPREPPQNSADNKSWDTWRKLFKDRRAWSLDVVQTAGQTVSKIKAIDAETTVVQRSGAIAVENIKLHLGNLRPRYEQTKAWAESFKNDQEHLLRGYDRGLDKLRHLPVVEKLEKCLQGASRAENGTPLGSLSLESFIDPQSTKDAREVASNTTEQFATRLDEMENLFEDTAHDASEVVEHFGQDMSLSDSDIGDQAGRLVEEIEVIARKIDGDYNHILTLPESEQSQKEIARTALLHTRNFLPTLQQINVDLDQLHSRTAERKNNVMATAVRYLQRVSTLESMIQEVRVQSTNLDISDNDAQALDTLNFVMRLPSTYGALLVECVRRQEWAEKVMSDSSVVVEELSVFNDEEAKRRRKWAKEMGDAVNLASVDNMVLGVDINLTTEKEKWPNVGRQDIEEYLNALRMTGGLDDIVKDMETFRKGLDAPTKRQNKALRNNVHADGRQSLLFHRENEEMRILRSENSKLEDRLKSSDSRVRKLEDMLHRQSLTSRPSSNHAWAPNLGGQDASPVPNSNYKPYDAPSRTSSVSSRKFNVSEEKTLNQRIVSLETELAALQASRTQSEESLRAQIQDAVSTKEDLLNNMEAQQREFDAERRLVEGENNKLKIKLEENEDEMDRMLESRENDTRVREHEQELEKVRKECATEVEKAQGQVDYIRNDYTMQREKAHRMEQQVKDLNEEVADLSARVQKRDMSAATNHRALRTVMLRLSKDSVAPEGLDSLVESVEELAKQHQEHMAELEKALELIRADNGGLEARIKGQGEEIDGLNSRINTGEREVCSLQKDIADRKTELASIESELEAERREHGELRSKFAAGETDAKSMRTLVAEKEEEIVSLYGRLTSLETTIERAKVAATESEGRYGDLKTTLEEKNAEVVKMDSLQKAHDALASDLKTRSKQAEEVAARLYGLKNTMGRLLEQVGYLITRQNDVLTFQRVSKAAASTVLTEPSSSMARSVSGATPTKSFFDTSGTLTNWSLNSQSDFDNFMSDISSLPPEAFTEAIIKRVKDADHTSRKYVKEARNYRDKYRRIQSECHDKITIRAFKEGDLVLFLPTWNQVTGAWAAFNVGCPHYFLREQESHRLRGRDHLLARISKIESRIVDLSKSMNGLRQNSAIMDAASDGGMSIDDENPFELSDGLRWYLMDATEEKLGSPMTIGSSKSTSTVAAANVDAQGSMGKKNPEGEGEATVKLRGSLDVSRRSSTNSKAGVSVAGTRPATATSLEERLAAAGSRPEDSEPLAESQKRQSGLRHSSSQEPADPDPTAGANTSPFKSQPQASATPSKLSPTKRPAGQQSRRTSPEKPKPKQWDSLYSLDINKAL